MKLPKTLSLGAAKSDACDHSNRHREDVALRAKLGMQSHRMSIEWGRVEPADGRFDDAVLDRYRAETELLRAPGIEPMVTLHRSSFPTWLAERGGAIAGDLPSRFARFVDRVPSETSRSSARTAISAGKFFRTASREL